MAYDPRTGTTTPTTATPSDGGRSQPMTAPTPVGPARRTPEEIAAKEAELRAQMQPGQSIVYGADGMPSLKTVDPVAYAQATNTPKPAPSAAAGPNSAMGIQGVSTQPGTQTFATNYGANAAGGGAGFTPTTSTAEQRSAGTGVYGQTAAPAKPYTPVSVDYSRYDQAAQGYDRAVSTFQSELDRLSGVDPFGNEAFLRKATDRAAGQAAGIAAGGLSTATARAGDMRQAQGVQASLAAQGIEQQAVQRNADQNQAAQLRLGAAGGLANTLGAKAANEVELAKLQTQTMAQNMQAALETYKFDKALTQQDVESLRGAALEYARIDQARYQSDQQYAAEMDQQILGKYVADQQLKGVMKQIQAQEHISPGEFLMGAIGAAGGVLGGIATAPKGSLVNPNSDRRLKFDVRDPDLRDLEDFLGRTKGKLYRYKDPGRPGNKAGVNYGPMAQDLAKSKIGRTVLGKNDDGTYHVDAARLALADHAALAELAREVKALKSSK